MNERVNVVLRIMADGFNTVAYTYDVAAVFGCIDLIEDGPDACPDGFGLCRVDIPEYEDEFIAA